MGTDERLGVMAAAVAVWRAWADAGRAPHYHERAKDNLRREWPTMYRALVALDLAIRRTGGA